MYCHRIMTFAASVEIFLWLSLVEGLTVIFCFHGQYFVL